MSLLSKFRGRISDSSLRDTELAAISVGVARSTGGGTFHFDTRTEDTTGR